ncbi:MAG: hypothetical protein QW784_03080 [Acidilobaceae archaeon]
MILLVAMLGAIIVTIQPITNPVVATSTALEPTLFATVLFLAIRGASGVTWLIQSGIINVYISYPIPKISLILILILSRVLIPSLLILASPLLIVSILLSNVMVKGIDEVLGLYLAYTYQAMLYGLLFLLIALRSKSQTTSGLISVALYFTYTALYVILVSIGRSIGSDTIRRIGESMYLPGIVYYSYLGQDMDIDQMLLVPIISLILILTTTIYFSRRFEVL